VIAWWIVKAQCQQQVHVARQEGGGPGLHKSEDGSGQVDIAYSGIGVQVSKIRVPPDRTVRGHVMHPASHGTRGASDNVGYVARVVALLQEV